MKGLGDNLYQRPFIRAAARSRDVYLETPWPELYVDLPRVFPIRTGTTLRTQRKNEERAAALYREPRRGCFLRRVSYGSAELRVGSIIRAMERSLPLKGAPLVMDVPPSILTSPPLAGPYALVRPVTRRREWLNPARNPRPEYVAQVAADLRRRMPVVVVADLESGEEELEGALPPHDVAYLRGELDLPELLSLAAGAEVIVGGVGWIVPAAIALRRPAFVILGGNGGHNAPEKITDRRLDLSRLAFAMPDHFCTCERMTHPCDKTNTRLPLQWETFSSRILSSSPSLATA